MTQVIVLASGNPGKAKELLALFDDERIELQLMKQHVPDGFDVDETGTTFEENAWLKAEEVCKETGLPALADDSGLEVDALGGRPGVYSARYAGVGASDEENNSLLLEELGDRPAAERGARFRCVLALAVPGPQGPVRVASASGAIEGRIIVQRRGAGGFGYDPLFEALELNGLTTAEIPVEQKNKISHRARAAQTLRSELIAWLDQQDC